MNNYDLVIVGGGPAGSTLGTLVAQAGYKVLILEKVQFPRYKIGESLLPATVRDLADMLDIDKDQFKSKFVNKRGASFAWGSDTKSMWNFNFGGAASDQIELDDRVPSAFNVDRGTFDKILIDNAISKGVTVKFDCSVEQHITSDERIIGVIYKDKHGKRHEVSAKFVADASGQKSKLASNIGKRLMSKFFKKVAVWAYYENAERLAEPLSGNVLFQANDKNWLWFIPLSNSITSVGVVAEPSSLSKSADIKTFLGEQITSSPLVSELLEKSNPSTKAEYDKVRVCSDYSYCFSNFTKPGAIILGDAACFVDVLLSSGIHTATYSAVLAAQSINAVFSGKVSEQIAMNEYEIRLRQEYAIFYDGLVGLYDFSKTEVDYKIWLRSVLVDTSGICYNEDHAETLSRSYDDDGQLLANSNDNLALMRQHNLEQLNYGGEANMYSKGLPKLAPTLIAGHNNRSWIRAI